MKFQWIAGVAWKLALAALLGILAYQAWRMPDWSAPIIDRIVAREAEATRKTLQDAVATEGKRLDGRLASIQRDANEHLASIEANVFSQTRDLARNTDYRLQELTRSLDHNLTGLRTDTTAELKKTNEQMAAALAETQELLMQSSGTVAVLRPQLLGLMAASKVTMGQTAQSMRTIDDATPEIVASVKTIAQSAARVAPQVASDFQRTTENTRKITDRIAAPAKWTWRILSVAGKVVRKIFVPWS